MVELYNLTTRIDGDNYIWTYNNRSCVPPYKLTTGVATDNLTIEDTEIDAIARDTTAWSDYTLNNCCAGIAPREEYVQDFDFSQTRVKLPITGEPYTTVSVAITWKRRTYGVGSYSTFRTDFFSVDIGLDGLGELIADTPNDYGYQTCYESHTVT